MRAPVPASTRSGARLDPVEAAYLAVSSLKPIYGRLTFKSSAISFAYINPDGTERNGLIMASKVIQGAKDQLSLDLI